MDYDILTMSLAPSDEHQSQVQFALERGLPAMLGVLSIHRLTFPSRSFDMVHCSRCLVPWTAYGITNFNVFTLTLNVCIRKKISSSIWLYYLLGYGHFTWY